MAKSAYSVIYLSLKYAYLQDKNSQKSTEQKTILFSLYTPLTFSPTNYCTNHQQKRIREFVLDFTLLSIVRNYWYIIQKNLTNSFQNDLAFMWTSFIFQTVSYNVFMQIFLSYTLKTYNKNMFTTYPINISYHHQLHHHNLWNIELF